MFHGNVFKHLVRVRFRKGLKLDALKCRKILNEIVGLSTQIDESMQLSYFKRKEAVNKLTAKKAKLQKKYQSKCGDLASALATKTSAKL